jgi:hypothetical protein
MIRLKDIKKQWLLVVALVIFIVLVYAGIRIIGWRALAGSFLSGLAAAVAVFIYAVASSYGREGRELVQQTLKAVERCAEAASRRLKDDEIPRKLSDDLRSYVVELRVLAETADSLHPSGSDLARLRAVSRLARGKIEGAYNHWRLAVLEPRDDASSRRRLADALEELIEATGVERLIDDHRTVVLDVEPAGSSTVGDEGSRASANAEAGWELSVGAVGGGAVRESWRLALLVDLSSGDVHTGESHECIYRRLGADRFRDDRLIVGQAYFGQLQWFDFASADADRDRATQLVKSWLQLN